MNIYVDSDVVTSVEVHPNGDVIIHARSGDPSSLKPIIPKREATDREREMGELIAQKPMLCPADGCHVPLVAEPERFTKTCTGTPRHRWLKEDLYYLRYRYETLDADGKPLDAEPE